MRKLYMTCILFLGISSSCYAQDGDAKIGQKLFEQHNCNRCHAEITGGTGDAIFTRKDRKIHSLAGLSAHIERCGQNAGIQLSQQEQQHLAAYLNRFYKLK